MNARVIYVEQYGYWWKLSPSEWQKICELGGAGAGHEFPEHAALKRRSPLIGATKYDDGNGRTTYFPMQDGILIYSPLDWEPEDYQRAIDELTSSEG